MRQFVTTSIISFALVNILTPFIPFTRVARGTGPALARSDCVGALRQWVTVAIILQALVDILAPLLTVPRVTERARTTFGRAIATQCVSALGQLIAITMTLIGFAEILVSDGLATPGVRYTPTVPITTIDNPGILTLGPRVFKGLQMVVPRIID